VRIIVPEIDEGMFKEFMDFVSAKQQQEADAKADEEEVEIWDKEGRGARVKRSAAKPFLQSLGIDLDPETESSEGDDDKGDGKGKPRPAGKTVRNTAATGQSTVRKYFSKS
jgi:hypothetical protein